VAEQTPEHIQNLNERIMEVLPTILHDINNTSLAVHSSIVFADMMLQAAVPRKDSLQNYVRAARSASDHLIDLLRQAQSVLRQGEADYSPKPTSLGDCIDTAAEIYRTTLTQEKIALEKPVMRDSAARQRLYFNGDHVRMVQVLLNIFSNSKKAMEGRADKKISMSIETIFGDSHDTALLKLRNNGPRMPYDDTEKAFERGESTTQSTGLGLYICREIIQKRFGGKIYAMHPSDAGVAFYIELPLCTAKEIQSLKQ
jgi:signal transduction histidine kinase